MKVIKIKKKFKKRIMKIMKIIIFNERIENHEHIGIPCQNYENYENHRIPRENQENHEKS